MRRTAAIGRPRPSLRRFQVVLVVAVLLAGTCAAGLALRQGRETIAERQQTWLHRASSGVRVQIDQARSVLLGVRGAFAAAPELEQSSFARLAAPSLGRAGLSALIWTPRVPAAQRVRFERTTGFGIQGIVLGPQFHLRPAERKRSYYPLTFVAPFPKGARAVLGVDLSELPDVSASLASAARSGRIVVSPPFTVVAGDASLILLAPIYRTGAPTATPAQRLVALRGFSGAFYEIRDLALNALAGLPAGAQLQIFDGARRLFGPDAPLAGARRGTIDVGGRSWELRLLVDRSASVALPATILGAGAVLALLVALLFSQANRRQRELELAERQLRRQASITAAVLDATPDGIRLVDAGGDVLLANAALERLLGGAGWGSGVRTLYEEADRFAARTTDPDRFGAALQALRSDPLAVADDEYELAGAGRIFRRYSAPVRGGADAEILGRIFVHREVTAERRAERAKDEFIALASHELRTPLTSICGYLEIARDGDLGDFTVDQLRVLDVINRNAQRLLRLVDDLLVVARGDVGRLGIELKVVDIVEIAQECVQGARPSAEERAIALSERLEADRIAVRGDRARLAQVLDNLVSNALKFTPAGGRVKVCVRRTGDAAVLEVADTGIGIPVAEQARLFERFYRTTQVIAAATPGTGLGLAISKMIVKAHGGRIDVDSEEGAGATFRVSLPVARQSQAAAEGVDRLIPA